MFSDLPRQPSQQIVMRKTRQSIMYETAMLEAAVTTIDTRTTSKSVDVDGADRHLFFFRLDKTSFCFNFYNRLYHVTINNVYSI